MAQRSPRHQHLFKPPSCCLLRVVTYYQAEDGEGAADIEEDYGDHAEY
jgi:hypothetical protein